MHHFFAYVARLRYIRRWGLMRSLMPENDAEHSLQVAMIAHAIAEIGRDQYGRDCDPEHILALGVYHDVSEVITGDMPTPVKYHSQELRGAYKGVERMANERLLTMLPENLRRAYAAYLTEPQGYDRAVVKAAGLVCSSSTWSSSMASRLMEKRFFQVTLRRLLSKVSAQSVLGYAPFSATGLGPFMLPICR